MSDKKVFFGERETIVWLLIMGLLVLLGLAALVYLAACVHRFSPVRRLGETQRVLAWLLSFLLPAAAAGILCLLFNATTMIVVMLHLSAAFLLCELPGRLSGRELAYDLQGCAAIAITAVYLGIGWFMAHRVSETDYLLKTDKALQNDCRIVEIADAHLGITLDGESFRREVERIAALAPDAVVIVGDFVDDDSTRDDMLAACRALGELETRFGVYFVYGNHDKGYYSSRDFSAEDLQSALEQNGVKILADESVLLDDGICLIGRRDRSDRAGASAAELLAPLDHTRYLIVLDHQPNDFEAEAAAGADLVLCGHTHGGHIFPAGQISMLIGANDAVYGHSVRGGTDFIVSSGISGWAIPFKTGTRSEFAVIDIRSAAGN